MFLSNYTPNLTMLTNMALHYPIRCHATDKKAPTFQDVCSQAIELQVPLVLTEDVILCETIRLREQQILRIEALERVTISGNLHSLFLLNNKSRFILQNVDLNHTLQTDDHKEVGAAINVRSKGSVEIRNSRILSISGFCIWAVQKSGVQLHHCELYATMRSAMVCFGQVVCQLNECRIDQAGVHGLCARGKCRIQLSHCHITDSAARAIYAYADASVHLEHCHISGTLHPAKAAIEISSMGSGEKICSALTIRDCHVVDNRGVGIRLRGSVAYQLEGQNILEENDVGDWDILEICQDDQIDKVSESSATTFRRDESGSSFRQGDWWCRRCHKINAARSKIEEACGSCGAERSKCGRFLTTDEIRQCNQGMDIRTSLQSLDVSRTIGDDTENSTISPHVVWEFDGDDEKGWLPYDDQSSQLLEDAYHRISCNTATASCIEIADGKYLVDLIRMEQINNGSQFLRSMRRRIIQSE